MKIERMKPSKFLKKLCLFLLLCQTIPLFAQIRMTDALGRTVALERPAKRIVSLSPSVTEILFAIGAGSCVVGRTEFCDYPAEALSLPAVGGFSGATVSVERIVALRPDLVIVSGDMHQRLIPLLEAVSIAVFAVEPQDFREVYATIEALGRLCGYEAGAADVVSDMEAKLDRVKTAKAKPAPAADRGGEKRLPSVFWVLFSPPLMTAGGGSFVNEVITLAGGRNIFGDSGELWPQVSIEQVLARKPDWILGGADLNMDAILFAPLLKNLAAVKNRRIALIDADSAYRYGPRLADAVAEIAGILHN
jgi:iron complex transport system substrate-binding protein